MKIKAPNYFIKLQEQAIKEQDGVLDYLVKKVGYGKHWVVKNTMTCLEKVGGDKKLELMDRIDRAEIITRYAWARWSYENYSEYRDRLRFTPAKYDKKKKVIVLGRPISAKKFAKGLEKTFKSLKNYEPKEGGQI